MESWLQTVSSLAIVFGAILLLPLVLRGLGFARASGRDGPRVTETCSLGGRGRLVVVEIEGERLLLATTDRSVSLLRTLPARAEPDPELDAPEDDEAAEPGPRMTARARARRRRGRPHWQRFFGGWMWLVVCLGGLAIADEAAAQAASPPAANGAPVQVALDVDDLTSPEGVSGTIQALLLLTLLSVAPSLLLMATCFTRIVIVLSLVRQAIGVHQLPPNQVIVGLALFTTLFVMAPVGNEIHQNALLPYMERELDAPAAMEQAIVPVRKFLAHHTREKDLALFLELDGAPPPENVDEVPLSTLMPAYLISEIRTAFEIGFMIYLPFLVIDLVIASMLIAMGMIVLPPITISLPFKLMLFVLIDGWNLMITSLVTGLQ